MHIFLSYPILSYPIYPILAAEIRPTRHLTWDTLHPGMYDLQVLQS